MTDVDLSVSAAHVRSTPTAAPVVPVRRRDAAAPADPGTLAADRSRLAEVTAQALAAGIRRIGILTHSSHDGDPAGLEHFVRRVGSAWTAAGLEVALSPRFDRRARPDGLVEVWDPAQPIFRRLWSSGPRVVLVDPAGATPGRRRLSDVTWRRACFAAYGRRRMITRSPASKDRIVSLLACDPSRVEIVAPGIDRRFAPGGRRSEEPFVVAVGPLEAAERHDLLIDILADTRRFVPRLRAVIVGEGTERRRLEAAVEAHGASAWLRITDPVPNAELVALYRQAWVVASTSLREGWSTLSDAAACGTPAVASDHPDHRNNVIHEVSGLLAGPEHEFSAALVHVLTDDVRRERLSRGALDRARSLTWEACAADVLSALVAEARPRR